VYVVATTTEGTEAALTRAASLARIFAGEREARLVLVIPHVDGDAGLPAPATASNTWLAEHYRLVARRFQESIQVTCCSCLDTTEAIRRLTLGRSVIVMGGPALWLWPSAEERLAARLRRSGRDVVFVGCNGRRLERLATLMD
jgi:hypothetical protein